MESRKLLLTVLILSLGITSIPQVSAKPKDLFTEQFRAPLMGIVSNWGTNYTTTQSASIGKTSGNGTAFVCGQDYDYIYYFVRRNYYRIDTRSLDANAIIESVELQVSSLGKAFEPLVESAWRIQKWTDTDDVLNVSDYSAFDGINYDDGSLSWDDWIIGWNNFTISNTSLVVPRGYTDVCMRLSTDIDQTPPVADNTVTVDADPSAKLIVTYRVDTEGEGHTPPSPPWERVPAQISQFLRDRILTPFWNMWIDMNVTFEGILATIFVVGVTFLVFEFYHLIRKTTRNLKISKITFY